MILRPATFADEKLLFDWRNDPTVREVSSNTEEITTHSHSKWLARMIANTDGALLFIAEVDGIPVGKGQIERAWKTYAFTMDTGMIGYSIQEDLRGKGYGLQLATMLVAQAKSLGYATVGARIKRTNLCSIHVALAAGIQAIEIF